MGDYIPLENCVKGRLYKLHSRNLAAGVFDGKRGFIGIREKFDQRYLFTEYHWDSPAFATAKPIEDLGVDVPEDIPVQESLGSFDQITQRPTAFDKPVADGGRGWYFTDTGEASRDIRSYSKSNEELFKWIQSTTS